MSISIIIPAYNAEKTIERCLNSVLAQEEIKNIKEVLVVDDGSKDNTVEIVKSFETRFSVVKLIQKVNGGVSSARNEGIRQATGEYIIFCDSDDEMKPQMCKRLYETLLHTDADLGICGYEEKSIIDVREIIPSSSENPRLEKIQNCFDELFYGFFLNQPWNKIFRRKRIGSFFDESLQNGEDIKFVLEYMVQNPNCMIIPEALYVVHTENDNSLSRQRINALKTTTEIQICLWSFINQMNIETSMEQFASYCISLLWAPAVDGILLGQFNSKEAAEQIKLSDQYIRMLHKFSPDGLINKLTRLVVLFRKKYILSWEYTLLVVSKRLIKKSRRE